MNYIVVIVLKYEKWNWPRNLESERDWYGFTVEVKWNVEGKQCNDEMPAFKNNNH